MPARIRFFARYGNVGIALLIGLFAVVGFDEDTGLALLSAGLLASVALSVHAAERMAFLESEDEWRRSEQRIFELRRQAGRFEAQVSEH